MSAAAGPDIITDRLVLCLDAGNVKSYSGSGTVWKDSVGSNNGTLINSVTFSNLNRGVLIFDGTDEYVNITSNSSINDCLASDFTYEIWTNPKVNPTFAFGKLFAKGAFQQSTGFNGITYSTSTRSLSLSYGNPSVSLRASDNNGVLPGNWYHFIFTRIGTTISFYLNNKLTYSYTNSYNFASTFPLRISSNSQPNPDDAHQSVAIFRQYTRGFSSTDVAQNYNATKGRFGLA
jgi:hypothetical protein